MKSKKIIAFLCAAAMTTSAFAGLTITASAADTTEFSDNFDSQTFGMIVDGTNTDTATEDTIVPGLKFVTTSRTGGDRGVYVDSNGDTVYTGSYYSIEEKSDSDNYLHLSLPMFGDFTVDNAKNRDGNGRYGHVDFIDSSKAPKTYTADATKDVVFDFDMKMNDGILKGVVEDQKPAVIRFGTFDSSAKTANAVVIDKAALSIGDEWVHARIVATNAGSKVYINGEEKTAAASNVKEFASIGLYTEATTTPPIDAKGDWLNADTPTKTPSIDIDNFVIYTTDAGGATATSAAPAATAQTPGGQINPMPTPYVIPTAPTLVAPKAADADSVEVYRFDNDDTNAWYIQSDEQNITDISGLNIHFGGKTNGEASTFAQITKAKTGKALQMQAGKFSHAGRGPLLSVNTSMPVSYADGVSTAMSMNVMLSAPKGMETGAAPRLYFLKSDSKAGEDKQGAYNQVAAVLTTDIDEKIYRSGEGSDVLSAYVTPDEWHTVTLVITPTQNGATHRLFIDGAKDAAVKCDYVGSGDTATYMDNLPLLSPESKSASNDAAPDYSLVTIDNLLVYQGTNPEEPRSLVAGASSGEVTDPTPKPTAVPSHSVSITQAADNKQSVTVTSTDEANTAFDGVLVHASYNTSNTLKSVKTYDLKNIDKNGVTVAIPDTDKVYEGDKLMVWNNLSGMVPYGTATAAGDAPVVTYAVTVGSLTGGTITASPAADITAGKEVTLTVTPAEGKQLKEGTLKVMNGSEEVAVTNNKFQMPAANVTVTAEFEDIPAPVVTYTVVITADEHITDVKLGTKTGTKTDNTFTFTEVEAGEYTFNVTYENGYEKADASPTSITVSAEKLTETISSKKSADPAITGSVTVTGNPIVGKTLTASVTGLNDGKTPVYAWQANTGAEGAYETIADATASTFVVPADLVGKTIKAVVTADGTSGKIESTPTEAVTVPTYAVTITEPTGGTLTVKNGTADVTTGAEFAEGTEISVSATPDADHKGGVITVTGADETPITVTEGKFAMPAQAVRIAVTFTEKTVVPFADGTVTYEADGATPLFTDFSRTTPTVVSLAEAVSGNTTKVESIPCTGQSGAKYVKYSTDYPAVGDAVKVSFDFKEPTRNAWVSVRGNVPTNDNRNNNADKRIFTVGCEGSAILKIYNGGTTAEVTGSDALTKWYHIDATINNTAKTFDIRVYDYSEYNDYEELTPLYTGTGLAFRDNTVTGVVAMDYHSNTTNGTIQLDNVYINDPSYVAPNTVTVTAPAATDGTLTASKSAIKTGDEVVITATPKDKRKLTSIKVNGTEVATTSPYTYTVPDPAVDVTVSAEFARQDVKSVAITGGPKSVKTGTNGTYTVAVTDIADKVLDATDDNAAVTWTAAPADTDGAANVTGISFEGNVMTVANDAALGNVVLTASIPTDATAPDGEKKTATYNIKIVDKFVYALAATSATTGGGATFTVGSNEAATEVEQDKTVTVVPKTVEGYNVTGVSYTTNIVTDPVDITSTKTIDASTLSTDTETITVAVTYTAIDYTITNANTDDITIKVNGTVGTTAHIGDTITVEPSAATGKKIATVAVTKTTGGDAVSSATSFTMPAADVTVTATVETWDGVYYSQDFSGYADTDAVKVDWVSKNFATGVSLVTGDATYGNYVKMDDSNQNGRGVRFTIPSAGQVSGNYKISFDANLGKGNVADRTRTSISIGNSNFPNNTVDDIYGSGYIFGLATSNSDGAATVSGMSENNTFSPTNAAWYHYDIVVTPGETNTAVVTITPAAGGSAVFTGTATINGDTTLKNIQLVGGRVYGTASIDNIKVTTTWYEAPTNP